MSPDVDDGGEATALEIQGAAMLTARLDDQISDESGGQPVSHSSLSEHPTYQ